MTGKPQVTCYDSGCEHSQEHWIEVRQLVEDCEEEVTEVEESRQFALSA